MESKPDEKKWIKVYPIYVDKALKLSEGRRVKIESGCEKPTAKDVFTVCSNFLGLECKVEPKSHPRDWEKKGRVIVKLFGDNKKPLNETVKNKNQLLKYIGETIAKHKVKPEQAEQQSEKKRKKRRK